MAADLVRAGRRRARVPFRHPLVRRAVYDGAPPGWRLGAHERVAAALAARGAAPGVRAYHVEQFAPPGRQAAIALLAEAAAAARRPRPRPPRAGTAPLRLLPDGDWSAAAACSPRRPWRWRAGRLEEGREALIEALGAAAARPALFKPTLIAGLVQVEQLLGRHADAYRRLTAALDEAPPAARATLETQQAIGCVFA